MQTVTNTYRLTGLSAVLMHCGQTVDPLNQFSKAMKKVSSKRDKTEDDLALLATLEWWAGLYTDKRPVVDASFGVSVPKDARLVIPAHVIDSCIREGARKSKDGKAAAAGTLVEGDGVFMHEGATDINALANDEAFRFAAAVRVGTARVVRTRPRFDRWTVTFKLCLDLTVVDVEDPLHWLEAAGRLVGIGDWRPGAPRGGSYGRFQAEKIG